MYNNQKAKTKFKYLENKRAFKMKSKGFFIVFKGISMEQIKQIFNILEGESPKFK